ncbi:MAG: phenylalanine--tRNA ligase subunit beta-related protein [Minisyncoccota bacterium]
MKITRDQLQEYFAAPLPDIAALADAFTFHAFEIDSIEGDLLDIKVLPNRVADCATPEGVAHELAAILDLPLTSALPPEYAGQPTVAITVALLNAILGSDFSREEMLDVFRRLQFKVEEDGEAFRVTAPLPRTDIVIPEDVAEEVGQILGYDRLIPKELPPLATAPDQARYRGIERMKDQLIEQGFTEVSTQSFAKKGAVCLENPFDKTKPWLRTTLEDNLNDALAHAKKYAPLFLSPGAKPKLFEVGAVFPKEGEYLELRMTERVPEWGDAVGITDNLSVAKLEEYGKDYTPVRYTLGTYHPFSLYPFVTRDIALWVPSGTKAGDIENVIRKNASKLLARLDQFDQFEKEGRISLAFRLVFESPERTLTDEEVNEIMKNVTVVLSEKGYEVR